MGAPIDDYALGDTGRFVERFGHRLAFDQILETDSAFYFCQDRPGVGIPFGDALTALDLVALVHQQSRTVLDTMHRALGAIRVEHGNDHIANHCDGLAIGVLYDATILELDLAVEIRLDERLLGNLRGAADMERPHRELGAGLADRLC